jgi:hypothetical protein
MLLFILPHTKNKLFFLYKYENESNENQPVLNNNVVDQLCPYHTLPTFLERPPEHNHELITTRFYKAHHDTNFHHIFLVFRLKC